MEEKEASAALVGASAGVYGLCGMCLVDVVEDLIMLVFESYSLVDKDVIDDGKIGNVHCSGQIIFQMIKVYELLYPLQGFLKEHHHWLAIQKSLPDRGQRVYETRSHRQFYKL